MNAFFYLFIICVMFYTVLIFTNLLDSNMVYVKSELDGNYYLVRNVSDKVEASNTLAKIRQNIILLSDELYKHRQNETNIKYSEYITRLYTKSKNIIIIESEKDSIYTSYSVNKGEQIVFCLRKRTLQENLHDINLMMYVVLHEISHVACPIYDNHGPLFREIFSFLTTKAIELNIYKKIDFKNNNINYCGLLITDSIV